MRTAADPRLFQRLLDDLLDSRRTDYLEAVQQPPAASFRFNPLKHTREFRRALLSRQGFRWERTAPDGARVLTRRPRALGQSLSHVLGHIYVQDRSSMTPVQVLDPQPGEHVLDMCAAPGSKTTQIAAAMGNEGLVVANEVSSRRLKVLVSNLRRFGALNTGVRRGFGEQCGNLYFEEFDRVLLDPPCSALGTLAKSPEVLSWWTPERSAGMATVQKNLILSGLKALKPGGVLVYSTCTITPEENEEVVAWALRGCPVELEAVELTAPGSRGGLTRWKGNHYPAPLRRAVRIYPFDAGGEGFFIARLRKLESFGEGRGQRQAGDWKLGGAGQPEVASSLERISERFQPDETWDRFAFRQGAELHIASAAWLRFQLDSELRSLGLPLAHCFRDQARLTTEGTHLLSGRLGAATVELDSWEALQNYADRVDMVWAEARRGQVVVAFQDHSIGHALLSDDGLLSRFPRTGFEFPLA